MAEWDGQVAVITGAASGIGAGLARHALDLGMIVYAADLDGAGLQSLATSSNLHCSGLDVSDAGQVEALAARVFAQHRQVNLLFNNAGVLVDGKSWERSTADWRWLFDVNVMGVVHGIRSFVPRMLAQATPGRIINTSSIGGLLGGGPYLAPYQGSKHMITAITESLYQELQAEQAPVTASLLCPGEVATGIWSAERNRPQAERNVLGSEAENAFRKAMADRVAAGQTPEAFATWVFEGIEADRFWLVPEQGLEEPLRQRLESMIKGMSPPAPALD
jgi:NAD(P)-dependent dehydrogenase (short-subunit alcohol dehydrogenase family)